MNSHNKEKNKSTISKQNHKEEVENIVESLEENKHSLEFQFKASKKLRYYDYIIIIAFVLAYTSISYLISYFVDASVSNLWEYLVTGCAFLVALLWLINGWVRNKNTAKFFNDSRRRYHTTLSTSEGFSRRISKILILIFLLLIVVSIFLWKFN